VAGAEAVAADWAAGNSIKSGPVIEELPTPPDDLPVTRKTWSAPGCRPVVLYRVDGGGHGWPGGPRFLPAKMTGPVARSLDTTGILLDMAQKENAEAAGRHTLGMGDSA
jgi:polyhydroxybutyrate depolymerase